MSGLGALQGVPGQSIVDEGDYQLTLTASNLPAGVTVSQWSIDWNGDFDPDQTIAGNGSTSITVTQNLDGNALEPFNRIRASATLSNNVVVNGESGSPSGELDNDFAGGVVTGASGTVLGTIVDSASRTVVLYRESGGALRLRRYDRDGSVDQAFGTPAVDFNSASQSTGGAIVVQGSKIVVGASIPTAAAFGTTFDFAFERFDSTGAKDSSFGVNGVQVVQAPGDDFLAALTLQGAKIVAAGQGNVPPSNPGSSDFQVARLTSEGLIDTTFGATVSVPAGPGYVRTDAFTGEGATDVAALPGGGLVAVGTASPDGLNVRLLAVKYNDNGSEAWRSSGNVTTAGPFDASVAVQADGGIVIASDADDDLQLQRLLPATGALDPTWGGVYSEFAPDTLEVVNDVAIGADGAILTAGGTGTLGNMLFAVNRYTTVFGGVQRDPTFGGGGGSFVIDFSQSGEADDVALTPGGSLVVAGSTGSSPQIDLVRIGGDLSQLVFNVAPQVLVVGTAAGVPGQTQQVQVFDPSAADRAAGYAGFIDYDFHGDTDDQRIDFGSLDPFAGTAVPTYVYNRTGTYQVFAEIMDKDFGAALISADDPENADPLSFVISSTARMSDPVNPGKTVLFVGAQDTLSGAGVVNTIKFSRGTTGSTTVNIDGVNSTFTQTVDRIVIYGNGGDDTIQPQGTVSIPVEIYGGAGNDKIKGGSGADILVGGDGDDLITGGVGRNFMVGGNGADKVVGDVDDDILVGGVYVNAGDRKSNNAIMAEWTSSRTYPQRVDNLRNGGGANGAVRLVGLSGGTAQTVFDDGAQDKLTGDLATDWFFANVDGTVRDKITDLAGNEFTDADRAFVSSV